MQVIQDMCLITIMMNAVLKSQTAHSHQIIIPSTIFNTLESSFDPSQYNHDIAQALLALSLAVTHATYTLQNFNINTTVNIPLNFSVCPVLSVDNAGSFGNILFHNNILYIIFSGTADSCMTSVDLTYKQIPLNTIFNSTVEMKCHQGFISAYNTVRDVIIDACHQYQPEKVYITGHSLGGALSSICALDLASMQPIHYSFASPMVFNPIAAQTFNQLVDNSFRIANISDLVTIAPLPIMPNNDLFAHIGHNIIFQTNTGDYIANHTQAYIDQYSISTVKD